MAEDGGCERTPKESKGSPPARDIGKVIPRPIETEMKYSYIDYAMSVIVGRALPDVRDGLKPVHRRILFAMSELSNTYDKPYKKCARIVGEVLGKFHPHGDLAVYESLVRMAQDFSLRYPLIDGQGNFGSVDGDSPAAMRYTECRLSKISDEMLTGIDEDTVDFVPNYDSTLKEPLVMPSRAPNLLINGSAGIAVGMATNIPPHNLGEVVDALVLLIDRPETDINDLMGVLKGPDFPTGGIICGRNGIFEAYSTGRGVIRVRARHHIELKDRDKRAIIVTELPYQVNKAELLTAIAELVKEKKIEGITDLRDESDRDGMRIVIELRRDAIDDIVINQLFARTALETSFGIINLALVNNKPEMLPIKEMLIRFLEHREQMVIRSTKFRLKKAEERIHLVDGLILAVDNIDEIIKTIRDSKKADEARDRLEQMFKLTEEQSKAILDMKLQKLTGLERQALKDERVELEKKIEQLKDILSSKSKTDYIIRNELLTLKKDFGDNRRTEISEQVDDLEVEDLIPIEDVVVTITNASYIKRVPLKTYSAQHRGGKGLIGMSTKEEDFVVYLFVTSTHDYILFLTNKGRCYWLKTYRIPDEGRYAKGKPIVNLLPKLEKDERVQSMIPVAGFEDGRFLIFATKRGIIKKSRLSAYGNVRNKGIIAVKLESGDELVDTRLTDGEREIVIATKYGLAARFHERAVRPMGRNATGVIGVRLRGEDEVVSMAVVNDSSVLLTLTEKGYGKRTPVAQYRKTKRGAHGVITMKVVEKNGKVISALEVTESDEVLVTSRDGMIIRVPARYISVMGRNTTGVRIMKLDEGDRVMAVSRLAQATEGIPEVQQQDGPDSVDHIAKIVVNGNGG